MNSSRLESFASMVQACGEQFDRVHAVALTRRIECWARENPHEYLTVDDAAVKFDCTPKQFRAAVANLRADGRSCVETVVVWRAKEEA